MIAGWLSSPAKAQMDHGPKTDKSYGIVQPEGLLYLVMARGNDGQKIFLRQSDYQAFIEALRTVRQRYPFSLCAYVLMSNHFHLLLEVDRFPTGRILQSLLTGYVRRFNKIHLRQGHLFEGDLRMDSAA